MKRPDRGGHSVLVMMLVRRAGSQSPSKAQAWTTLPLRCVICPSGSSGGNDVEAGFLAEFAHRGVNERFAGLDAALRNRPRAVVASLPERAAGMREQHLDAGRRGAGTSAGPHSPFAACVADYLRRAAGFRCLSPVSSLVVASRNTTSSALTGTDRTAAEHKNAHDQTRACRSRSALPMTDTELTLIAAAAIIGLSSNPNSGYSTPAAIGTPARVVDEREEQILTDVAHRLPRQSTRAHDAAPDRP